MKEDSKFMMKLGSVIYYIGYECCIIFDVSHDKTHTVYYKPGIEINDIVYKCFREVEVQVTIVSINYIIRDWIIK